MARPTPFRFEPISGGGYEVMLGEKRLGVVGQVDRRWSARDAAGRDIGRFRSRAAAAQALADGAP